MLFQGFSVQPAENPPPCRRRDPFLLSGEEEGEEGEGEGEVR